MFSSLSNNPHHGGHGNINDLVSERQIQIQYPGITDVTELFNNTNNRPLAFEIELLDVDQSSNKVARIICTCDRPSPQTWSLQAFSSKFPQLNLRGATRAENAFVQGNQGGADFRDMLDVLQSLRDARYYGPFRNAINQGTGDYFDLKIDLWNEWKTIRH